MNSFFSNKLKANKYFSILKKYKKSFSRDFILKNYGLFIGDKALFKLLKIFELMKEIKDVKGDVIEFGVWNGNNIILMKKIADFLKINKKISGYDTFKGMTKADGGNLFKGDIHLINYITNFFKLKKIKIIKDDILNLKKNFNKIPKLSLIYIDCDMFKTTDLILKLLHKKLSKNGLIVFDEALLGKGGEGKAAKLFFSKHKSNFTKLVLKKNYQPDLVFKKK